MRAIAIKEHEELTLHKTYSILGYTGSEIGIVTDTGKTRMLPKRLFKLSPGNREMKFGYGNRTKYVIQHLKKKNPKVGEIIYTKDLVAEIWDLQRNESNLIVINAVHGAIRNLTKNQYIKSNSSSKAGRYEVIKSLNTVYY